VFIFSGKERGCSGRESSSQIYEDATGSRVTGREIDGQLNGQGKGKKEQMTVKASLMDRV